MATTGPQRVSPPAQADQKELLAQLVEEALKARGVPAGAARELGTDAAQDAEQLIQQAARKVPSWVPSVALIFGLPSVGSFVATAQSVWGLPDKVAQLEAEVAKQGELHRRQQEQLDRIERLLKIEVASHPASRPAKGDDQ